MSVFDVLRGAAKVGGAAFEGYGVDRQIKVRDALAQRDEERAIARDRLLNAVSQRQLDRKNYSSPITGTDGGVSVFNQDDPSEVVQIPGVTARTPATPRDPVADHAANRRFDINNPLPRTGGSGGSDGSVARGRQYQGIVNAIKARQTSRYNNPELTDEERRNIQSEYSSDRHNRAAEYSDVVPPGDAFGERGAALASTPPAPAAAAKPMLTQAQYDAGIAQGRTDAEIAEHYTVPATIRRKL